MSGSINRLHRRFCDRNGHPINMVKTLSEENGKRRFCMHCLRWVDAPKDSHARA